MRGGDSVVVMMMVDGDCSRENVRKEARAPTWQHVMTTGHWTCSLEELFA